jgi:hypothetical protein
MVLSVSIIRTGSVKILVYMGVQTGPQRMAAPCVVLNEGAKYGLLETRVGLLYSEFNPACIPPIVHYEEGFRINNSWVTESSRYI